MNRLDREGTIMPAARIQEPSHRTDRERILAFMSGCSIEATRPGAADASLLRDLLGLRASVFIASLPGQEPGDTVEYARAVRRAGLEPTPHIAARSLLSLDACDDLVRRLAGEAGVDSVMLIGGDRKPAGAIASALEVLESGLLARRGIRSVGIAGYPEPHPQIGGEDLEAALVTKLASAQSQGLDAFVATQFSFEEDVVLAYVRWLRARGLHVPVKIGMAGPTSVSSWLAYARRCGVRASAAALASRTGLAGRLFRSVSPDPIISALARAAGQDGIGEIRAHLFSFGGAADTARWLNAVQTGRFVVEDERGFRVLL